MRTIVLLAVIALGGASQMIEDCNHHHEYRVSFERGTCKYRNQTLKDGASLRLQFPCEEWVCNATQKTLTVEGCAVKSLADCVPVYRNDSRWPYCCPCGWRC
uniref:Putative 8.9 kDa protein n=1 Tax=Ixodes ricinus TaxID=34613 RepID=A0A6B0UF61_IXORI